ncbi:MAG: tRNA epoxyqueuosine(34) reductase QueG [Gemmatimonadota bacterium]|nr:tRNA epoxyqueuosine(34) reductase QueG [Gemmatimonadota bacterium]
MTAAELTRRIKAKALAVGFDLVGVARAGRVDEADRLREWLDRGHHGTMSWMENWFEKRVDPRELVPGCRSIVAVGLVYHTGEEGPGPETARVASYARGEDYHRVLKDKLYALLDFCRELDPEVEGRPFVDSAPVMDRYWAERAGLGWRGKNTLLLNKRLGSDLFLGELLLTAELVPDRPAADHCGTCTACIDACPTDAIVEPRVLDARRCISYWTIEHRDALDPERQDAVGEWLFGCDVCQEVCPWNRKAPEGSEPRLQPRAGTWPETLDDLLRLTEEEFDERFADTAVERTRRRGLVRNAAIVAGNTGLGSVEALEVAAGDDDPVVAGAARRALEKRAATVA